MIEPKKLSKMSENLDEDLEWLIDGPPQLEGYSTENGQTELDEVRKSDEEDESDLDDIDGLTKEERELLKRNTILNDVSDREDYDLKQKLEKANADLEKTDASNSAREVKVMFKQKLVDVEAPPLEYNTDSSTSSSESDDEKSEEKASDAKVASSDNHKQNDLNDEKILVEKGGKFNFVSSKEETNSNNQRSEKIDQSKLQTSNNHLKLSMSQTSIGKSSSWANQRPASAPTSYQNNRQHSSLRPVSASRNSEYDHIKSPYAMSPEMKDLMKKRALARTEREREEQAQLELKKQEERQNAEYAWRCWVEKKNNEYTEMKKKEQQNKPQKTYDSKKEAEEAYAMWVKEKRRQIKQDRLLQQQKQLENDEGWYRRDRKECNQAFKQWKNKKRQEAREARKEEKRIGQQTRSDAFKMQKIRRLLMSIKSTQTTTW